MRIVFWSLCFAMTTVVNAQEPFADAVPGTAEVAQSPAVPVQSGDQPGAPSIPPRDPTVASQKILGRLESEPAPLTISSLAPTTTDVRPAALPKIYVKAIVLSDPNHGVAMLQCADRKLTVRLSRDLLVPASHAIPNSARLSGFAVEGQTFYVADFSDRSLLLRTGDGTMLIQ